MSQGPKITGIVVLLMSLTALTGTAIVLGLMYLNWPPPSYREHGSPPESHADQSTNNAQSDQRGTLERPLIVRTIKTEDEAKEQAAERDEKSTNDRRLIWFTAGLAISTVLLVVYTGSLASATRALVRDAKETAQRQLRAYVGIGEIELRFRDIEQLPGITKGDLGWTWADVMLVSYKNYGSTPAFKVYVQVNWQAMKFPYFLPVDFDYADRFSTASDGVGPSHSYAIIDPGNNDVATINIDDSAVFKEARESRAWNVYIYGHIDYTDIYTRRWRRNFCFLYEPWGPRENPLVPYSEHNDETETFD